MMKAPSVFMVSSITSDIIRINESVHEFVAFLGLHRLLRLVEMGHLLGLLSGGVLDLGFEGLFLLLEVRYAVELGLELSLVEEGTDVVFLWGGTKGLLVLVGLAGEG